MKPRTWLSLASKIAPYRTGPGDRAGADTVTVTCNEILCSLNAPEQYILAIVEIEDGTAPPPHYIRKPFATESDFGVTSVNDDLNELLKNQSSVLLATTKRIGGRIRRRPALHGRVLDISLH